MLYCCRRYQSDINTDRPCVSKCIGVRRCDGGVQLRNVKKRRQTKSHSKETRRLVTGARCKLKLLVDVETKGDRGRRGVHI
jgi:hypothetical protein